MKKNPQPSAEVVTLNRARLQLTDLLGAVSCDEPICIPLEICMALSCGTKVGNTPSDPVPLSPQYTDR
jgi:hypothetical protein